MPVKRLNQQRSVEHSSLVNELLEEWSHPAEGKAEPVILEESGPDRKLAHVYVIWSKWETVDRAERSEIIMEAADERLEPDDAMGISVAMGLTPDEAKRLGIG